MKKCKVEICSERNKWRLYVNGEEPFHMIKRVGISIQKGKSPKIEVESMPYDPEHRYNWILKSGEDPTAVIGDMEIPNVLSIDYEKSGHLSEIIKIEFEAEEAEIQIKRAVAIK